MAVGCFERTFATAQTGKISVCGNNGGITYGLHNGPEIKIEATVRAVAFTHRWAERLGKGTFVTFAHDGERAQARVRERAACRWFGHVEANFLIRIPRGWSGEVSLETDNGRIFGDHVPGSCINYVLRTSNAPIQLTGPCGTVRAQTSNDVIQVTDARLSGNNHLQSSNGELTFEGKLAGDARCDLITSNDHIAVVISEPDVTFDMTASEGRIQLPKNVNISRFERERVIGRVGDGTARLRARTSNGSIRFGSTLKYRSLTH